MTSRLTVLALASVLFGTPLGMGAAPALAQDNQVNALAQQIQRLRDDLTLLQRDYYQGRTQTPPPAATLNAAPAVNTQAANQIDARLAGLEDELRALVGTVEQIQRGLTDSRARLDKLVGDVDFRLNQLEQRAGQATAVAPQQAPVPTPAPAPTAAATPAPAGQPQIAPGGARPPGTQLLGTIPQDPTRAPTPAQTPAPAQPQPTPQVVAPAPTTVLPNGTTKVQYDYAYGLLQQFRIPEAERAFTEFIAQHANDELSHNARYWLGETFYARAQYQQAAVTFFDGYQKAPQGPKAADNLLKLGMSLGRMDQKQEACATLAELTKQFPNAGATIREQATAERRRLSCT